MKMIRIPITLFIALLPFSAKAQTLLPKVKNSEEAASASTKKGSTSTASYTIGSTGSQSATVRTVNTAKPAAVKPALSDKKVTIPRADREMPDAKVSTAYVKEVRTNVHFRVNRTELDMAYLDNAETITELLDLVDNVGAVNVTSVEIVSTASPEGELAHNQELAEGRCNTLADYIASEYPSLGSKIIKSPDGESWTELRRYVEKDENLSPSTKALIYGIMERETDLDRREMLLKQCGTAPEVGGIYSYLFNNYFPLIRNTGIYVTLFKKNEE